jgi:hypothetical protein
LVAPFGGLTAADFAASPDRQSPEHPSQASCHRLFQGQSLVTI